MRSSTIPSFILVSTLTVGCGGSSSTSTASGSTGSSHSNATASSTAASSGTGGVTSSSISTSSGDGTGGATSQAPMVTATTPLDQATGVHLNANVSAVFSEAMDPTTITASTFTVSSAGTNIAGSVTYVSGSAVFTPTTPFTGAEALVATISTGAKSAGGVALAAPYEWSFTTAAAVVAGVPVDLGTAGNYVILASSEISTVSPSSIVGALGLSPAAATFITGFALMPDASKTFSTSAQVTGDVYAADYATPTPAALTTAVSDMRLAFTAAAGRAPDVTELGAGDIGGKTLTAGVYRWSSGLLLPTDVTLDGNATDVWVLQIAQDLTVSNAVSVTLAGGALAKNVFWQVGGLASLGTTAHAEGVILSKTAITLNTGASINGRLFAQTAVTLAGSTVVAPAP